MYFCVGQLFLGDKHIGKSKSHFVASWMLQVILSINWEQYWQKKHHQNQTIINNYEQISPLEKQIKYEKYFTFTADIFLTKVSLDRNKSCQYLSENELIAFAYETFCKVQKHISHLLLTNIMDVTTVFTFISLTGVYARIFTIDAVLLLSCHILDIILHFKSISVLRNTTVFSPCYENVEVQMGMC